MGGTGDAGDADGAGGAGDAGGAGGAGVSGHMLLHEFAVMAVDCAAPPPHRTA